MVSLSQHKPKTKGSVTVISLRMASRDDEGFIVRNYRSISKNKIRDDVQCKKFIIITLNNSINIGYIHYEWVYTNTTFLDRIFILCNYRNLGYGSAAINMWHKSLFSKEGKSILAAVPMDDNKSKSFMEKTRYKKAYVSAPISKNEKEKQVYSLSI